MTTPNHAPTMSEAVRGIANDYGYVMSLNDVSLLHRAANQLAAAPDLAEALQCLAEDLERCANSDTLDLNEVCADLASVARLALKSADL